jgi:hypothetical protein
MGKWERMETEKIRRLEGEREEGVTKDGGAHGRL